MVTAPGTLRCAYRSSAEQSPSLRPSAGSAPPAEGYEIDDRRRDIRLAFPLGHRQRHESGVRTTPETAPPAPPPDAKRARARLIPAVPQSAEYRDTVSNGSQICEEIGYANIPGRTEERMFRLRSPFRWWEKGTISSAVEIRAYAGGERTGAGIVTTEDACCTTYDVYGSSDKYPSISG